MNKYETIGIFSSIAVMALALIMLKAETDTAIVLDTVSKDSQGTVIVGAGDSGETELADAITEAATLDGELTKLIIDDIRIGTGPAVVSGDTLVVDYIGSTATGIQFDSSYARGEPFIFTVGGGTVIEGWEKGLIGMKVGGQRIIVIPPEMGYGNRQVGTISPNSVLVFAVELLEIK